MPDLASQPGREALKWLFFCYGTVHPAWARLVYPERVAGDGDRAQAVALARAELIRHYGILGDVLGDRDFGAGPAMSLADLYLAATLHWEAMIGGSLTRTYPALAELKARVLARPGLAEALAD